MKNFHKNLNFALTGGLIGIAIMTLLAPRMIGMILTPPVSFGVNCEPAAAYSMSKLILFQIVGLLLGAVLTLFLRYKIFGGKTTPNESAV